MSRVTRIIRWLIRQTPSYKRWESAKYGPRFCSHGITGCACGETYPD